jgi:hypothetical protein
MDAMRDSDTTETQEWLDAVAAVKEHRGVERAAFIVSSVVEAAQRDRIYSPQSLTTPYCNTIPLEHQPALPGDRAIEHKLRSIIRWNALAGGIVGTHAGDLISEICLAVEMGCEPADIGKTIHPHPTLGESIGMAAEVFEGHCTDLPPMKR